jgi:serine palmitoyltransferase
VFEPPQEIDELVDEWIPEPLAAPLTTEEQSDLASIPVVSGANGPRPKLASTGKQVLNLASYNFTGLTGNGTIKERAIENIMYETSYLQRHDFLWVILWKYGVGSCGPLGFYGTIGASSVLSSHVRS